MALKASRESIDNLKPATFADVLKGDTASLATIKKYQGEMVAKSCISQLTYWLRDQFNFARNLNDIQIGCLSDLILGEYAHLSLADIKLAYTNGLKGNYGQTFQNLDPQGVFLWVKAYFNEKSDYLTIEAQKAQESEKEAPTARPEMFKKIREKFDLERTLKKQKSSLSYRSLIHYVEVNDLNIAEVTKLLRESFTKEYEQIIEEEEHKETPVTLEMFIQARIRLFLFNRSKKHQDKLIAQEAKEIAPSITLEEYRKQNNIS